MSHSLQALESKVKVLVTESCPSLCNPMDCSLPGKNTGVEKKKKEYWNGFPFPSPGESSQTRDQTQISCIAGRFFTIWATREACEIGLRTRVSYTAGGFFTTLPIYRKWNRPDIGLSRWLSGKESTCNIGDSGSIPRLGKISRKRKWQPTPASLPGKSHEQRSVVGYSTWGRKSWTWLND